MHQEDWIKYGVIALAAVGFAALLFVAVSNSEDLEGPTWVVTEIKGDGTAAAPIEGTALTAMFDGGQVAGSAGCNSYFASYTTDGDSIAIGPAGATLMFCEQPEGAMDQEQAYLALLQSSDTWDVSGDTLTLSSGGTVVLTYADQS